MIQPVAPGPVVKFAARKSNTFWPALALVLDIASLAKFTMCATMCTNVQTTMDHAVAL